MFTKNYFKVKYIIYWVLMIPFCFVGNAMSQTSQVVINNIEYRFDNGKWYNHVGNRRADEIVPGRLVVRLVDRGLVENFDFITLGIQGISLASPRKDMGVGSGLFVYLDKQYTNHNKGGEQKCFILKNWCLQFYCCYFLYPPANTSHRLNQTNLA